MFANLSGTLLFFIGSVLIVANFSVWYQNVRNLRRGIDRHISYITLMPQFVMVLSAVCFHTARNPWFAVWFPFAISLSDFALWILLFQTIRVILDRPKKH